MTTKPFEFPESFRETTGGGPDFPGSAGDRERGRFRPSSMPRHTAVAVVDDEGRPIARTTEQILEELLDYNKAILLALSLVVRGEAFTPDDILGEIG